MRINAIYSSRYRAFMTKYLTLGHMEPTSDVLCNSEAFYLPHHGITKEQSSTTKLRVVFDGSQKSSNGFSLNDRLCNGPKLQHDLFHVILKWRKIPVVFMADIKKMYRQIRVTTKSANIQRIVWRDYWSSPSIQIDHSHLWYQTYGVLSYSRLKTISPR